MYESKQMPQAMCMIDGVLSMRDGSNVKDYLRSRPLANADSVVLLTREDAQRLLEDAAKWRFSQIANDERFAFAA